MYSCYDFGDTNKSTKRKTAIGNASNQSCSHNYPRHFFI